MAVYRPDPRLLKRQVQSIIDQNETRWYCHVGIDGTDSEAAKILYEAIGGDERFVVNEYAENLGFYKNFERILEGVDQSSAWVALADQDDFWYSNKIERLLSTLGAQNVSLVSGQAQLVDTNGAGIGRTARRVRNLAALLLDNQITGSFSIFSNGVLRNALPFPKPTDVAYHDHWIGVVAACLGRIVVLEEILQDYVQHGNNVIGEEVSGGKVARRLANLTSRSGGIGKSLSYISSHRWGWRVAMAQMGLSRISALNSSTRRVLQIFAKQRLSVSLLRVVFEGIRKGDVRPMRGIALLLGAAASRRTSDRMFV